MKLLEKRQINDVVQRERKTVIDSGVFLAKKVDTLRADLLNLEKQRADFINGSRETLEQAIGDLKREKVGLDMEVKEAKKLLSKLREPLDEEWKQVEEQKDQIVKIKLDTEEYFQSLVKERATLGNDKKEVDELLENARENYEKSYNLLARSEADRRDTKKALAQAQYLKETKEADLYLREVSLEEKRKGLEAREETLKKDRLELNKEKKLLALKKQRIQ